MIRIKITMIKRVMKIKKMTDDIINEIVSTQVGYGINNNDDEFNGDNIHNNNNNDSDENDNDENDSEGLLIPI